MVVKGLGLFPGAGILSDIKGRSAHQFSCVGVDLWCVSRGSQCYLSDWTDGIRAHIHILAPSTYIFFASVIPALTFGEQLSDETEGQINGVHVLLATAMCGTLQSIIGGQPLLIVGVAEPIVLVYGYMFIICKQYSIPFLPWASCILFWVALFCALLAIFNTCNYIHHFTRFSGELFGFLIAVLFLQQAIRGLASEFDVPHLHRRSSEDPADSYPWLMFNGAFALFLAFGLLGLSLLTIHARRWNLFNSLTRRIISDYGTAISVLIFTLVSFIPQGPPPSIPRRLVIPSTFDGSVNYSVLDRLGELEAWHVGAAMIPALIIAVLFFFDHNVSSQLAQEGLHLKKPTAYHWDFMLLAVMTALCGILGIPPVNGVIPQAPMHSRANTVWRKDPTRRKGGADADELAEDEAPYNIHDDVHGGRDFYIRENRVSNLLQSLLCGVCMLITPVLQKIPRSVLWGFFAFMAVEGLPGSQFYKRLKLFITDSKRFHKLTDDPKHDLFLSKVHMSVIYKFTFCQLFGLLVCYGITWAGIAGISFPLFIMVLVPLREYGFPKFFSEQDLQHLDPLDLSHESEATSSLPSSEEDTRDNTRGQVASARGPTGTGIKGAWPSGANPVSLSVPPLHPSMANGAPMPVGGSIRTLAMGMPAMSSMSFDGLQTQMPAFAPPGHMGGMRAMSPQYV